MTPPDRNEDQPETAISDEAREDRRRAEEEVAERRRAESSPDPHHELTNPASDPDPTEYPDPYEERPDPRAPEAIDTPAHGSDEDAEREGEGDDPPADPSTSDPAPPRNIDRQRGGEGEGVET